MVWFGIKITDLNHGPFERETMLTNFIYLISAEISSTPFDKFSTDFFSWSLRKHFQYVYQTMFA